MRSARERSIPLDNRIRTRRITFVLALTLGLNWLIAAAKIAFGMRQGNLTLMTDGYHSILDGANNVVGLVAINLAARPADEDHPYGHRKFEHVAAMLIGGLVMLLCWETLQQVFARLSGTAAASDIQAADALTLGVIVACALGNIAVAMYERHEGKKLSSGLLTADSTHTFSDSLVTALSLVSVLTAGRFAWIDPLLAVGVVVFLFYAGWSILSANIATMTDANRLDAAAVRSAAESVEGVVDAHAIRSHGMENDIHLDLHIVMPRHLSAEEAGDLEERVEAKLREVFPQVTLINIHHEVER